MMFAVKKDVQKHPNEIHIDDVCEIWAKASALLKQGNLNPAAFTGWISPLVAHSCQGSYFVLIAKNEHMKTTVNSRYIGKISSALTTVYKSPIEATVLLEAELDEVSIFVQPVVNNTLNPKYVFKSFVKGKSNEFAYGAALAVAEEPGIRYNPLFLHGDVGLGKTHLMHSIGNFVQQSNPNAKILYTSSENLVNEFVASIRTKKNQEFRDKYRTLDMLLIDDIQFLLDKEGTQEEFFHTFNALHSENKQIVLTSDRHPFELKSLEDRLRSRFGSGLTTDITLPDLETRIAILEMKVEFEQMDIEKEVIYFISKHMSSNIRELEGALNTVYARAKLTKKKATLKFAEKTLEDMIYKEKREVNVSYIQDIVSSFYNIDVSNIRGKKRNANIIYARHIAMYLSRMLVDSSLKEIGRGFGGRDHSTIIHACEKITGNLEKNKKLKEELAELERRIKQE